jgi:hypothetical protein
LVTWPIDFQFWGFSGDWGEDLTTVRGSSF